MITPPGDLLCKAIFFLKWQPTDDQITLRQSIVDLIWTIFQNAIQYNFTSIAFSTIGYENLGCNIDILIRMMTKEMKNQLIKTELPLTIKFVSQPNQDTIYNEFCKQVLTIHEGSDAFFSSDNSEKFSTIINHTDHKLSKTIFILDLPQANNSELPEIWEKSPENKMRFIVPNTSEEYRSVINNFDQIMRGKYAQIIRLERIQNERWYLQYLAHSRDFRKRLNADTEKRLYHGCPEQAANSIIEGCFNRSYAGINGNQSH